MQERRGAAPLLPTKGPSLPALTLALVALCLARGADGAQPTPDQPKSYARDVAPVLDHWCISCHAGAEPHGGLRLDSFVGVMRGGDTGPVVIAGDPNGSLLLAKVERRHRPAMPPRRKLPAAAVALIRAWIAAGAPG